MIRIVYEVLDNGAGDHRAVTGDYVVTVDGVVVGSFGDGIAGLIAARTFADAYCAGGR